MPISCAMALRPAPLDLSARTRARSMFITPPRTLSALTLTLYNLSAMGGPPEELATGRASDRRRRAARHQAVPRHPQRQPPLAVHLRAAGAAHPPGRELHHPSG